MGERRETDSPCRVNMYASTWICTKVGPDPTAAVDAGEDETDAGVVEALEL